MDSAEQALKLRDIARLTDGELKGWWRHVMIEEQRPDFDGERAALMDRARQISMKHLSE